MHSSEKNFSSFDTNSTGTCLSQSKQYFLSLINPNNLSQYRLLNLMERNGYFASNNIESNKNESKNLMMKNIFAKKYKNNKIGLKYKQNEDASFNSDKMNNIFINHNSKNKNHLRDDYQINEFVKGEINENIISKKMNNSLESRQLINNLLRNQKNKIKEIKSKINDNFSGISFSSSSSFENNNKQFCTPSSSNSIELNCNNQNDNSQDWNTKQIYIEYNNNYNEDNNNKYKNGFNNNNYKIFKNFNNYNYNNNNYKNQFDNNNNLNNSYYNNKGNDNNFSSDNNLNHNFGMINENKNEEEKKEKNEINIFKLNSPNPYNENKIENINVKINSFEKRKISRSPLRMADVFMINKKCSIPNKNLSKNEYKESIAFNNKNFKKIIFIKKSVTKIKQEKNNNDKIKISIKNDKNEINEERKEVENQEVNTQKEKKDIKSEIELEKIYQEKKIKGNIQVNKKIKENNEIREKIDKKENINAINLNKDKINKEKENAKDKELELKDIIIKKFNDNKENKENMESKINKEIKENMKNKVYNENMKNKTNKENNENMESQINKENKENMENKDNSENKVNKVNDENRVNKIDKENKENKEINKENKENKELTINKNNNDNNDIINSIKRLSNKKSQNKDESIEKINSEKTNTKNNISVIKEIKRNIPLRDNYNNIKYISNNEINEKNHLMSSFKVINNLNNSNNEKKEYGKRTTPSIRRRFKDSKSKISSYNNLSPIIDNKINNEQNIINRSLKRIVSIENIKEKDSTTININRINLEENNNNKQSNIIANDNKDKKGILIEKSIKNTNILNYNSNTKIEKKEKEEKVKKEEDKEDKIKEKNNDDELDEEDDDKEINLKKFNCESEKEERIKRRRKLYWKEDNKEDGNIKNVKEEIKDNKIKNLNINKANEKNLNNNFSKKKNINTFSFENLFYVNKNQNKFYQNKKEGEENEYNDLSSLNNDNLLINNRKERNRKNKKEEEIKKNEEENNIKKKEDINKGDKKIKNNNITIKNEIRRKEILNNKGDDIINKIENIKIIKSSKKNENIKKKKRITISEDILVEEINTTKPVAKINISQMFLKKIVNLYNNNQINNLQMNKRQNIIKNNNNQKEKMNKNIYLFSFDKNDNFLQFDLRKKKFKKRKISELEDLSDTFEQEYTYQNTLLYNTLIGSFILTGKNCDILYYYNSINETIIKLCQFKHSHHLGCLLLDQENNRILILGGKTNICESFSFDTEEVKEIPNLNFDRATASYIISNDKIVGFFGFSFKKGKYIYNIEYINKNTLDKWEVIDLNINSKEEELSFHLRNISTFNYENDQNKIIIYGGKQGRNEKIIDGYYYLYEVDKNKLEKMEGLYYNIIKDLKFINVWKNSELIDIEEKSGFFFDKQKQILELPDEDKIIDGHNIYTSIIIDSDNNIHYLTNNQKYITVYKYITK